MEHEYLHSTTQAKFSFLLRTVFPTKAAGELPLPVAGVPATANKASPTVLLTPLCKFTSVPAVINSLSVYGRQAWRTFLHGLIHSNVIILSPGRLPDWPASVAEAAHPSATAREDLTTFTRPRPFRAGDTTHELEPAS